MSFNYLHTNTHVQIYIFKSPFCVIFEKIVSVNKLKPHEVFMKNCDDLETPRLIPKL